MPHQATVPVEADVLRPLVQAMARARFPEALTLLLLALLGAFSLAALAGRAARCARKDWYPSSHAETDAESDSILHPRALRRIRRLRAWIGWILRGLPAPGMALSGLRALAPRPSCAARAPP